MPWVCSNRKLVPLVPPHRMRPVDSSQITNAIRKTNALLALWHERWDTDPCEWWRVVCDNACYDLELLSKNARRDIRAGLRRCEVRRLDPDVFLDHGFEVYTSAQARYGANVETMTAERFQTMVRKNQSYAGRETWGAFANERLIAWVSCIVQDDIVNLSWAKSNPEYLRLLPNNALCYELTRHYLRDRQMRYVSDGTRSVLHDTNFQDFLCKMGYRRVYCPLKIAMKPVVRLAITSGMHRWGTLLGLNRVLPKPWEQFGAVCRAHEIAKACSSQGTSKKNECCMKSSEIR